MLDLAQTQRLFWDAVIDKKPVSRRAIDAAFLSDGQLDAVERLNIYAGMYVSRLVEALATEYPALQALLGEEAFAALAQAYIARHPSEHHSVAHIGRVLPAFLGATRRQMLGRSHPILARPDLSALADLERRRSLSFDTRDVTPAPLEALTSAKPDLLPRARLVAAPSVSIATYRYHVTPSWRDAAAPVRRGNEHVLVYRGGFTVRHRAVEPMVAASLRAMLRGAPLAVICECFRRDADPMGAAIACVRDWFALGLVASVSID